MVDLRDCLQYQRAQINVLSKEESMFSRKIFEFTNFLILPEEIKLSLKAYVEKKNKNTI